MMKNILLIFFLFLGYNVVAQRLPSGIPTQFSTGYFRQGWHQSDSGEIVANRDTSFLAKYSGTLVFRPGDRKFYYFDSTVLRWYPLVIDTTSLSNRINTKLNITDTTAKWWGIGKRWVDTVYRVNDSTVGFTINNGIQQTFQILGRSQGGGGGGSGTVTSVGLSMPSAFTVTNSPITTSGSIAVSGAGSTSQYIRGNGTLATTDTGMIPDYYLKVRGLLSGTSPITFNQFTGQIGVLRANTTGQLGVATFNNSDFTDNGAGLISLRSPSGASGVDTIFRTEGIDSIYYTISGVTRSIKDSIGVTVTASNGLTKTGDNIKLGGSLIETTNITSAISANRIVYTGVSAFAEGPQLEVITSGSVGIAVSGQTDDGRGVFGVATTGVGVYGTAVGSNGIGLFGNSVDGSAVYALSNSGKSFEGVIMPSSTNTVETFGAFSRSSSVTGANGIGGGFDFNLRTTTADQLTNRIIWKLTDATDATRTSAWEFWNVNSASFVRTANLAGNGQWTWDGYPALTAQTDTTTYKPIAIDGSGNVVKMAGWSGSGGGSGSPSLTYKNIGYGGIGNTLSTGEAAFQYDSIINELTVDSTSAIQHRASYLTLNPISRVDSVDGFGDSFMNREVTTSDDSAFLDRSANFVETAVKEHAVSGSGIYYATALNLQVMSPMHNGIVLFMSGFNTLRQNNILNGLSGRKTQNAIIEGYKSAFANHFLKSYVGAGSGSVTRTGSWFAPWDATAATGKSTAGTFTSAPGAYYEYTFTDSTVVVGLIGQNDAVQAGSTYNIYIDNVLVISGSTSDKADGIYDGYADNGNHIAMAEIITGLTYASHTVKVENTGSGVFIADYVGHLRPASLAPQLLQYNIPYMKMAGYAGGASNPARTDTMNVRLDSLYATYPTAYKSSAFMIPVNTCYDTATGTYTDDIHPNDVGHRQIFECGLIALSGGDYPEGSLYYGTGYPYFKDAFGSSKIIVGEGRQGYLSKFSTRSNLVEESIIQDDGTNIGINQTPGTYKLSVTGSIRSTADALFATSSGNVGIGTTSPGFKLDVNGFGNFQGNVSSRGSLAGFSLESRSSGTYAWGLYADNNALKFFAVPDIKDRVTFWRVGGVTIADSSEISAVYAGRTLDVHGSVAIRKDSVDIINSISSQYVLVIDTANNVDSNKVKRILASNLGGGATTIYNGDGTLSGNRTVTGGNSSLTFNTISNYRINGHTLILDQQATGFPYAAAVVAVNPHNYQLGYTSAATPTVYTKGAGLYIDTNNNAGLGASIPTTVPLYATGNSAYAVGFQSGGGNFYAIAAKTADYTATTSDNFITIDATGGNVTITLPAASTCFGGNVGIDYVFKRLDNSGNTITIQRNGTPGTDTIDGASSFTLTTQYEAKKIRCLSTSTWGLY